MRNSETEEWKDVVGYEGLYRVSNRGNVRSIKRDRNFLLPVHKGGYIYIVLRKDGKARSLKVHRLVATAFLQNPENKPTVNHIDGNKANNRVDNLEWATVKENVKHTFDKLGRKNPHKGIKRSEYTPVAKSDNRETNQFKKRYNISEIGQRFNRLTVIEVTVDAGGCYVKCRCECGNETEVLLTQVRKGVVKSCGCLRNERVAEVLTTHGRTGTPEYRVWQYAKARIKSKNPKIHRSYAGRGITMCDRWLNSFEAFLEDMGPRPSDNHSLDRIDVNGNYCKENCRWAPMSVQQANKRNTIQIEYNGEVKHMSEWSRVTGVPIKTLSERYANGVRGDLLFHKGRISYKK